jgi:hypothetical protein
MHKNRTCVESALKIDSKLKIYIMKNFYGKLFALVTTFLVVTSAQAQCNVTLNMNDSYGDGWNGGYIEVFFNGSYQGQFSASGYGSTANLTIPAGQTMTVNYVSGSWEGENTYDIVIGGSIVYSDGTYPSTGLVYTYGCSSSLPSVPQSGSNSYTLCSGNIYDNGGPSANYSNNSNGTTTIYPATAGNAIQLSFNSFNTENGWDYLYVYDGNSTAAPLVGSFTGTAIPANIISSAADGSLTLVFTSDGSVNRPGFDATISCIPPPSVPQSGSNSYTLCSGNIYDNGGPSANYANNSNGTTTIYPATAGSAIQLSFNSFNTENGWDYLDVYNGNSTAAPLVGSFTGTAIPANIISSAADGSLTLVFTSDGSVNRPGFDATISCVTPPPSCTENEVTIDVTAGTFPSEVSWEFLDETGAVVASGGAPTLQTICIPDGCYDFVMNDSFGDGWNGATYTVTYNGGTIGSGTLADGATGTDTGIGVNSVCDVYGCTDPASVNYNPAATIDDGSCAYPPANDDCANATAFTLTCGSSYTDAGTTANANNVGNGPTCTTGASTAGGVWYQFIGTGNDVTASLCGSAYDTKIFVYSGVCGAFTCEGGNDDACGLQSEVTIPTVQGTTYTILVAGYGSGTGDYTLTVTDNGTNSVAPTSITGISNICLGSSTTLTLNGGSAGSGATANWYTGSCGGTAAGTGNAITITPNTTTDYFVRYEGNCNTTNCATITVTVDQPSTAAASITGTGNPCLGTTSTLSVQGGSLSGSSNWEWYEGSCGGTVVGTGNSITVTPGATTTYFVAATANGACAATTCASGTVTLPTPSAVLSGNNQTATCAVNQNGYIHLLTPAGDLVASINSNGQNLGNVTATSYIEGSPLLLENCNNPGNASMMTSVMNRHWVITTQNAPTGPVSVLLPFTDNEIASLNIEAFNNANPDDDINFISDVGCTKYSGPNEDNLFDNDCVANGGSGNFEWHSQVSNGQVDAYLAGHPASNKYLTIDVNGFSEFWLHGSSTNAPLPVELTRFEANCTDNGSEISWTTASEFNASHFKIKRSMDGLVWNTIAFVEAAGNSQQMIDYSIEDNAIATNRTVYYLLEQYDIDGSKQDERFTSLNCEDDNDDLTMLVYPNPGNGEMTINFVAPEDYGMSYITLQATNGSIIENVPVNIKSGQNNIILDCSSYAPGIYIINISNDQFRTKTTKYSKH